jgi:hypothetical protein
VATGQAFSREDRPYPWGGPKPGEDEQQHLSMHCNCQGTGLACTSAVGLFPTGQADCGALDKQANKKAMTMGRPGHVWWSPAEESSPAAAGQPRCLRM